MEPKGTDRPNIVITAEGHLAAEEYRRRWIALKDHEVESAQTLGDMANFAIDKIRACKSINSLAQVVSELHGVDVETVHAGFIDFLLELD